MEIKYNEELKSSFYCIIQSDVLFDKNLSSTEKLLYAYITSLTNERGYCFAKNKHFAEKFKTTDRTIQRYLVNLKEKKYIFTQTILDKNTKEVLERRIYIREMILNKIIKNNSHFDDFIKENEEIYVDKNDYLSSETEQEKNSNMGTQKDLQGGTQKNVTTPPDKNVTTPPDKNVVYNNKYINNNIYIEKSENLKNLKFEFPGGYNEPLKKWCDYKKKIGQPLSQESLNELHEYINEVLLKDFKEEDRPKELEKAVNYSIANNYKTIFPEKKIIKQEIKASTNSSTIGTTALASRQNVSTIGTRALASRQSDNFIETNKEVLTQQIKQEIKEKEGKVDSTLKVYSIYCKEKKVILSTWYKENLYFLRRYDFSKIKCLKGYKVEVYFADYYDEKIRWDNFY